MTTATSVRTHVLTLALLISITTLGGCDKAPNKETAVSSVTSANLADKVEQARTPADHEALAQYYEEQARVTERETAGEREARTRYERRWRPDDHSMGSRAREYYGRMGEGREEDASRYRGMAEWHREMATRAERQEVTDE